MADLNDLQNVVPPAFDAVAALAAELSQTGTTEQKALFNDMHHKLREAFDTALDYTSLSETDVGLPAARNPDDKPPI